MILEKPCKLVTGNSKDGYIYIWEGVRKYLHRMALEEKLGRPIKPGYEACHYCDIRNCVDHEHLYEGTHADNLKDAWQKGRMHSNFANYQSKKTQCPQGHPYSGDNLIWRNGYRRCKECERIRNAKRYK